MLFKLTKKATTLLYVDDDSSFHSTVTVEDTKISPLTPSPSISHCPRGKRVQFDESLNKITDSASTKQHFGDCWYNEQEYKSFKVSVVKVAKKVVNTQSVAVGSYHQVLTHVYDLCCIEKNEIQSDYESFLHFQDQMELKRCLTDENFRLGLDRLTIRSIALDISDRRRVVVNKVRDIQKECVHVPSEVRCEMIHRALVPLSLASRVFALEKARAVSNFC
mmetsp:Transcript_10383/g.13743  ORF Transcript_10383/g.13743 Transcript_10383/m.13743 type:complete len:220 (+) Transcript_10383:29-688(+)